MHDYSDLAISVEGTFLILGIIYLVVLVFSLIRWKTLYFNLHCKKVFMVMLLYTLIMIHSLARFICSIISFVTVVNCNKALYRTSFQSQNVYLVFMMFFPDITFMMCLLVLYFVLACVVFFGHIRFLMPEQIQRYKRVAKCVWSTIILVYFLLKVILIILFSRGNINSDELIIAFSIIDLAFPCFILFSEYKLHQKTSGLPYESSIFRNTKNNLNYRIFYWIISRFLHSILGLALVKVVDVKNYVVLPVKSEEIENSVYFTMLGTLGIVFVDKMLTEVFPLYCVINNDFMDLFSDLLSASKESLLHSTDIEDKSKNEISFFNHQNPTDQNFDMKLDFELINFEPQNPNPTQILKTKGTKALGIFKRATCKQINDNCSPMELLVRVIETNTLSPYIIESIIKDSQRHQNLKKLANIVGLEGFAIEKNRIALIYPYFANGSLHSLLHGKKDDPFVRINQQMKLKIGLGIARTLQTLHELNIPIVHGHLTPSNILLDKDFTPKIADILFSDLKKFCSVVNGYQNKSQYTAPEHLKEPIAVTTNAKPTADVYSFGLILWELATENEAFQGMKMNEFKKIVIDDESRPKITEEVPEELAVLIRCCWQNEAEKRPTFGQIVEKMERFIEEQEVFESFAVNTEIFSLNK